MLTCDHLWLGAVLLASLVSVGCGRIGYESGATNEDAAGQKIGHDGASASRDSSSVALQCTPEDPFIAGTLAGETIAVASNAIVESFGDSVSVLVESLPLWLLLRDGQGILVHGGYPAEFFTSGPDTRVEAPAEGAVIGSLDGLSFLGTCEDATPVSGFLRGRFGPPECASHSVTSTVPGIEGGDISVSGTVGGGVFLEYSQGIVAFNNRYPQGLAVVTGFIQSNDILYCFESVTTQTSAEGCVSAAFSDVAILGGVAGGSASEGELKVCVP